MYKRYIYLESHVTVEPVFDEDLESFKSVCNNHGYHVANLLMQKRKEDTEVRSKSDSFCTSHGQDMWELKDRMFSLLNDLKQTNIKVWRYKIEEVPMDSRYNDSEYPLDQTTLPEKEKNRKCPGT